MFYFKSTNCVRYSQNFLFSSISLRKSEIANIYLFLFSNHKNVRKTMADRICRWGVAHAWSCWHRLWCDYLWRSVIKWIIITINACNRGTGFYGKLEHWWTHLFLVHFSVIRWVNKQKFCDTWIKQSNGSNCRVVILNCYKITYNY